MKKGKRNLFVLPAVLVSVSFLLFSGIQIYAAYNHQGDLDSANFRDAYPGQISTKLDSCTLCHSGGSYTSGKKVVTLGSCQWCHYKTGYGADSSEENLLGAPAALFRRQFFIFDFLVAHSILHKR